MRYTLGHSSGVTRFLSDSTFAVDRIRLNGEAEGGPAQRTEPVAGNQQVRRSYAISIHSRTKTKSPQTNGIAERFHAMVSDEFYQVAFRK